MSSFDACIGFVATGTVLFVLAKIFSVAKEHDESTEELQHGLAKLRDAHKAENSRLEGVVRQLCGEAQVLGAERDEARAELAAVQAERAAADRRWGQAEACSDGYRTEIAALCTRMFALGVQLAGAEKKVAGFDEDRHELRRRLDETRTYASVVAGHLSDALEHLDTSFPSEENG